MAILYLSYDGLMEQLGQAQVYQYLRRLAEGHRIILVSYEKERDWRDRELRERTAREVREAGIRWVPLRYHKRPGIAAKAYDLAVGFLVCLYLALRHRIRVVHARSYVSSVLGWALKKILGTRFIFDMRGFWADERVELGRWRMSSPAYRAAKWLERRFLEDADVTICLTRKAVAALRARPTLQGAGRRFEVITTCTNLDLFTPEPAPQGAGSPGAFTLGYVGSVGPVYLFDEVLKFFLALRRRRPEARLSIVNRRDHEHIRDRLRAHGVPSGWVDLKSVEHRMVPAEMRRMRAGVFFIAPHPTRVGAVPTRMGEFLACGVPCIGNAGVGDVEAILEGDGAGAVLRDFGSGEREAAVGRLLELVGDPGTRQRCVAAARRHFSLEDGVRAYDRIYRDLLGAAA